MNVSRFISKTGGFLALVLCAGVLAFASDQAITTTMHGVIRSNNSYVHEFDPEKITGTLNQGKPVVVTTIRNASQDAMVFCVAVDSGQAPEANEKLSDTAIQLIQKVARTGDRGRVIVYGKSIKNAAISDWSSDPTVLAKFLQEPREAKGSNPYTAIAECMESIEKSEAKVPQLKAIFVVGSRPTEASQWNTDWYNQKLARLDAQLYLVSFDPGLSTGGSDKPKEDPEEARRRARMGFPFPQTTAPGTWYAPSLYRIAKDSAGDVINAQPRSSAPVDFSGFVGRLRNQVELTIVASEKDANTYREFKLKAPEAEVQFNNVLYVPKKH